MHIWSAETNWAGLYTLAVVMVVSPLARSQMKKFGYTICRLVYFIEPLEHSAMLGALSVIAWLHTGCSSPDSSGTQGLAIFRPSSLDYLVRRGPWGKVLPKTCPTIKCILFFLIIPSVKLEVHSDKSCLNAQALVEKRTQERLGRRGCMQTAKRGWC